MKERRKGFTLIELLAVIIILAIIALIAIPLMLSIINNSRKQAFKDSIYSIFPAYRYEEVENNFSRIGATDIYDLDLEHNRFELGVANRDARKEIIVKNVSDGNYCANGTMTDLEITEGNCSDLDNTPPVINDIIIYETTSSIDVTVLFSESDSFIKESKFRLLDNNDDPITDWVDSDELSGRGLNRVTTKSFAGLNQGSLYKAEVKISNTSSNLNNTVERTTPITLKTINTPLISYNTSEYETSKNISITFSEGVTNSYKVVDKDDNIITDWTEITGSTINLLINDVDCTVFAKSTDGIVTVSSSNQIGYIDLNPLVLVTKNFDIGDPLVYSGINWHVANYDTTSYTLLADFNVISSKMIFDDSYNSDYPSCSASSSGYCGSNVWSNSMLKTYLNSTWINNLNESELYDDGNGYVRLITNSEYQTLKSKVSSTSWLYSSSMDWWYTMTPSNTYKVYAITTTGTISSETEVFDDQYIRPLIKVKNTIISDLSSLNVNIDEGDSYQILDKYFIHSAIDSSISSSSCTSSIDGNVVNTAELSAGTHIITCSMTKTYGTSKEESFTITVNPRYAELGLNGAYPELYTGLIPVNIASDGTVRIADKQTEWYNYANKKWANAVVVSDSYSSYRTAVANTIIPESAISIYYVWIPRFRYKLFNVNNSSVSPQQITIEFENKNTAKSNGSSNGSYLSHPAFKFGSKELNGFWVAKFEPVNSLSALKAKPNLKPLSSIKLYDTFTAVRNMEKAYNTYGFASETGSYNSSTGLYSSSNGIDSHIMKNMEWGAMAYLSYSKYGLCTNGSCNQIGKNNYYKSARMTGCGNPVGSGSSSVCNSYINAAGSTTANISGIFDVSGCNSELTMGSIGDENGVFRPQSSGLSTSLNSRYYDIYPYSRTIGESFHSRGLLGDATRETLSNYGNVGSGGWYGNYAAMPGSQFWFRRGGKQNDNTAGLFAFHHTSGTAAAAVGFRMVLSAE